MKKTLLLIALAACAPAFAAAPKTAVRPAPKAEAAKPATPAISPELAKQREQRRADIDFWLTRYDGSELKSGEYRCPRPRFPDVSKQNEEIQAISYKMEKWRACYNAFAEHLNKVPEGTKRIPQDVLALMTPQEVEQAGKRIVEVQEQIAGDANVNAKMIVADFTAWHSATEAYVNEHNMVVKNSEAHDRPDLEARKNNYVPKDQ